MDQSNITAPDQSLTMATWIQAFATIALASATFVLCLFTKSLHRATRELALLSIDPQIVVSHPLVFVKTEGEAILKVRNIGACELRNASIEFSAALRVADAGATIPHLITEELATRPLGLFKPGEEHIISYCNEAKEVLRVRNDFQPLPNQKIISCDLACCVVGKHPASGVVHVLENVYEVTSSRFADIMLKDVSPKTKEPPFRPISK